MNCRTGFANEKTPNFDIRTSIFARKFAFSLFSATKPHTGRHYKSERVQKEGMDLKESDLIQHLRSGNALALTCIVEQYAGYVSAILRRAVC